MCSNASREWSLRRLCIHTAPFSQAGQRIGPPDLPFRPNGQPPVPSGPSGPEGLPTSAGAAWGAQGAPHTGCKGRRGSRPSVCCGPQAVRSLLSTGGRQAGGVKGSTAGTSVTEARPARVATAVCGLFRLPRVPPVFPLHLNFACSQSAGESPSVPRAEGGAEMFRELSGSLSPLERNSFPGGTTG